MDMTEHHTDLDGSALTVTKPTEPHSVAGANEPRQDGSESDGDAMNNLTYANEVLASYSKKATHSPDSAHHGAGNHCAEQPTCPSDDDGTLRSAAAQMTPELNGADPSTWSTSAPDHQDKVWSVLENLGITGEPPSGWAPTADSSPGGDSADHAAEVLPSTSDTDEVPASTANDQGLPEIQVRPGQLHEALTAAEQILNKTGRFFQRGDRVVCMRIDRATKTAHIEEMAGDHLVVELAGLSKWSRFDKRSGGWIAIDPCPRICNFLAKSWKYKQLKVLRGTVYQPHLRTDATICPLPGYDPETGLFGIFDDGDLELPEHPTREHASTAVELLNELLSECAFAEPEDRAAAMSALLTAAVRPSLALAPMFHVMAHQPGSGKSYLCQLITAVATATPGSPVAFPRSNDACDKLLLAQLMKAPAVIEFDNLTTDLRPFDKLCSALTSERLEGRQLGQSRTVIVGTKTLILSSGNNVHPVDDMVRRCISIHLDPGMETPATRVFKRPNLLDDVRRDRIKYVAAALTIIRAWVLAGRPQHPVNSLAGYSAWSDWCRQPLLWLGQADPASRVFQGLNEDPAQLLLGRVLHGWHQTHGSSPKIVRDVVKSAVYLDDSNDFRDALIEAAGGNESINTRKLGHWLSRNEGKISGVYRLRRAAKTRNAESWEVVESVRSVPSVLESPMS